MRSRHAALSGSQLKPPALPGEDGHVKVLVIGVGFAGACAARALRDGGADVQIVEAGGQPGGMLRTLRTPEGLPYEYGPRVISVFRGTQDIFPFLRPFADLQPRDIYQGTRLLPSYPIIPFPIDRESLGRLPCGHTIAREWAELQRTARAPDETNLRTYLESSVGPTLTRLAFEGFNQKLWGLALEDMPASWGRLRRLHRIAVSGTFRLPSQAPHYYPRGGFEPVFDRMLAGFDVRYGVSVREVTADGTGVRVRYDATSEAYDAVVSTAPLDAIFGHRLGPLSWSGYRIEVEIVSGTQDLGRAPDHVPFAWVYTPGHDTPVCRTTDFGVIHGGVGRDRSEPHVVLREIPDPRVKMYPVWWEAERSRAYLELAAAIPGLIPLGRLGMYKYLTTDSTLAMVQRFVERFEAYLAGDRAERMRLLNEIRGTWAD